MRSFLQNAPILENIKGNNCGLLELTGEDVICGTSTITYNLSNPFNHPITWDVEGADVIKQDDQYITIQTYGTDYSSIGGKPIIITATYQHKTAIKKLWIGKPNVRIDIGGSGKIAHATVESGISSYSLGMQGSPRVVWYKQGEYPYTGVHYQHFITDKSATQPFELGVSITNKCGKTFRTVQIDPCKETYDFILIGNIYELNDHPCSNNYYSGGYDGYYPYSTRSTANHNTANTLTIQISNASGQIVLTTTQKRFSLEKMLPGTYYARVIKNGKIVYTQTLLKR